MNLTADLVLNAANETGKGPAWNMLAQCLWWTEIPGKHPHRLDPATGARQSFAIPGRVGCFAWRETGGLLLAMKKGFATFEPQTGAIARLAEPERGRPDNRFNDGRCDRSGRFIAGSVNMARTGTNGQLWRVERDGAVTRLAGGVALANGLVFRPDGCYRSGCQTGGAVIRFPDGQDGQRSGQPRDDVQIRRPRRENALRRHHARRHERRSASARVARRWTFRGAARHAEARRAAFQRGPADDPARMVQP